MPTIHLVIKGQVQGVFYRATAKKVADETGVRGWIKNTREGNVEAMVSGNREQLQQFITWCKQGSASAEVTDIIITNQEEIKFDDFIIMR